MEDNQLVLLARQGIYNNNSEIIAYELLYRGGDSVCSGLTLDTKLDNDRATSSVIANLFANLSMDVVLGNKPAFINFTRNHLIQQLPSLLPKNRIVIELLENQLVDDQLVDAVHTLKHKGYQVALDDFVYKTQYQPIVAMADIIKIDILNQTKQDISQQLQPLNGFKGQLLAEKIEDREQFEWCKELGFNLFQGFYLNKPDPVSGHSITESKSHLLRLISELHIPDVRIEKIESIILQDPTLCYRILKLSNSASMYSSVNIETIMDAIKRLGLLQVRNWVSVLLMASMDNVPFDLIERTLIRAKMCEMLSKSDQFTNPAQAYTVGMLSTLDAVFNEPLTSLLSKIQLSDSLNRALLNKEGQLGQLLSTVVSYEEARFDNLLEKQYNLDDLAKFYMQGIEYADIVSKVL